MFATRHLIFATALAFQAAALPAADPNSSSADCASSWSAYWASSLEYEQPYSTSVISTAVASVMSYSFEQPLTTLCDGRERGNGPYETVWVPTETYTLESPWESYAQSTYTSDYPTCDYPTADVAVETASPDSNLSPRQDSTLRCSGSCFIYAYSDPTLYYWPVTTVSGDFCAQNGSTVFAKPTSPPEPNKAVVDGRTLTSPTNYVSFPAVYAMSHGDRHKATSCGPSRDHVLLPITESFYSGGYNDNWDYSFNFQDLNTVPVKAWNRQRKCGPFHHGCDYLPIVQSDYTPLLPLPTEVLNMEPEEWKAAGCKGRGYYFHHVALATPAPTSVNRMLMN
jgi:hypothetical protein